MFKLHIKLKNSEDREYYWNEVNFLVDPTSKLFVVRDKSANLVFAVPVNRLEYYERVEE